MFKFIYGVIPVPVKFTDNMADNTAGYARGPLIRLRPRYVDDRGLLEHELEHVRQYWRWVLGGLFSAGVLCAAAFYSGEDFLYSLVMFPIVVGFLGHALSYSRSKAYRFWSEVTCYRIQAAYYEDDRCPLFAQFIACDYNLDVTEEAALEALR